MDQQVQSKYATCKSRKNSKPGAGYNLQDLREQKQGKNVVQLYESLVRPHLKYAIQAWRLHLQNDVDILEQVQRRATRKIPELTNLWYENRLKACNLMSLKIRRERVT